MLEEKLGAQAGVHLIEGVRLIWGLLMFHWNETCFTVHSDSIANMHDGNLGTTRNMSQKTCYDWSHSMMIKFSSQYRFTKYMTFYRKNNMAGMSRMSLLEWIAWFSIWDQKPIILLSSSVLCKAGKEMCLIKFTKQVSFSPGSLANKRFEWTKRRRD